MGVCALSPRIPWSVQMTSDAVNHPSHYTDGKIEVADFIADKKLNFFLGNVVKYISRAGKKDPAKLIEDLEKANWYLKYEIERLKNVQVPSAASDGAGRPEVELTGDPDLCRGCRGRDDHGPFCPGGRSGVQDAPR